MYFTVVTQSKYAIVQLLPRVYTTYLVTPAFSATAIAASSAAVSTSGLRRKDDVRKLNMSRGERTLEKKSTNISIFIRQFSPKTNLQIKERHLKQQAIRQSCSQTKGGLGTRLATIEKL